jgi:phytoene dehydrogenase-like protein
MERRQDVVVVGAGVGGLLAAAHVAAARRSVTVIDPHPPGGRARSVEQDGYVLNRGAHAVYDHGALRRELDAVGVRPTGGPPRSDGGGLRVGERIEPFPATARTLATSRLLGARGKVAVARLLGGLQRLDPRRGEGRTVDEWVAALPDDAAALVRVLVRVTCYTEAPDRLDAGAAIRQLQLGLRGVTYVDGGWQWIVDRLLEVVRRRGATVECDEVVAIGRDGDRVVVQTAAGEIDAHAVVLAAGSPALAARLVGAPVPGAERLGPPVLAAALDVGTRREPRVPVLFDVDQPLYWSLHAPVARLAPAGAWLGTSLEYLRPGEPAADPLAIRGRLEDHARAAGADPTDADVCRYLHAMTVHHGLPLARAGGLAARPPVDALARCAGTEGIFLAGDWVGPDGMLADAAASSARAAASAALVTARASAERLARR